MIAFCFQSGEIEFAEAVEGAPDGVLVFADNVIDMPELGDAAFKAHIAVRARHAYDGETLLVPGVPEADGDDRLDAVMRWVAWAVPGTLPFFVVSDGGTRS